MNAFSHLRRRPALRLERLEDRLVPSTADPYLVKDINPSTSTATPPSFPGRSYRWVG